MQLRDLCDKLQSEYRVEDDVIWDAIDYGNGRLIMSGRNFGGRITIEQMETEARVYLDKLEGN